MNKVYFDIDSNNHWNSIQYWLFVWDNEPKCKLTFVDCMLKHNESCIRRRWLEINPFTRMLKSR